MTEDDKLHMAISSLTYIANYRDKHMEVNDLRRLTGEPLLPITPPQEIVEKLQLIAKKTLETMGHET